MINGGTTFCAAVSDLTSAVVLLVFEAGGHPRVSEEHAAGDGHSRDLPQRRLQDGLLRPVGDNLGTHRLLPASPEGGALQTDRHAGY